MNTSDLLKIYKVMKRIRLFEESIISLYPSKEIKTPVHLCIGQEAIAAGVCHFLSIDDLVFSTHRCHGHVIAKGMGFSSIMAELFGKRDGCSKGNGGSMHLSDPDCGILATSAIVGGVIPLAVGAALNFKLENKKNISVVFFGDGATEEGVFYESLNFASLKKLPVLFVCENNFYATNSPFQARQPKDNIFNRGDMFGIKGSRCDGNNAIEVSRLACYLIDRIRHGAGPFLLECRTYRWKAHVGPDCDVEKGCRPENELRFWKKKCPIILLENYLVRKRALTRGDISKIDMQVGVDIENSLAFAKNSPFPEQKDLMSFVYREG